MSCMLLQEDDARLLFVPAAAVALCESASVSLLACCRRHAIGASSPLRVPSAGDHGALLRRCSHDHDCPLLMRSLALIPLFLLSHLRLCLWQSTDGLTGFSSVIRSGVVLPPCPPPLSETSQRSPCVHLPFVCLHNRLDEVPLTLPI